MTIKEKKVAILEEAAKVLTTRTIKEEEKEMVTTIMKKVEEGVALNATESAFVAKVKKRKVVEAKAETEEKVVETQEEEKVEEVAETQVNETVIEITIRGFKEAAQDLKQGYDNIKPKAKGFWGGMKDTVNKPAQKKDIVIGVVVTVVLGAIGL